MRNFLKDLFFILQPKPGLEDRASILMYHNVGDDDAFFTVRPSEFERQLMYLKKKDFCTITLSELIERIREDRDIDNCVVLTFNDGYKSYYTQAFPLLKKYQIPATFFVAPEFLDSHVQTSRGYIFKTLSLSELEEMNGSEYTEFMSQTQQLVPLTDIPFEIAVNAIEISRKNLETLIEKDAPIFSFPKGKYTEQLVSYLRNHGWAGAVTSREGLVCKGDNLFILPRNAIDSKTSFTQFKGKLSQAIDRYQKIRGR